MHNSRKNTIDALHSALFLKNRHEQLKEIFSNLTGEKSYKETIKYYDDLIISLKEKINTLPIGFRYEGIFYIKIPYTVETKFNKYDGSLFMREDLVSWKIESGGNGNESFYNRYIYREPSLSSAIIKKHDKDITPVYAINKDELLDKTDN
tara:strand:- start:1327 stop:1776 length:450 start_codon:yes stop_codon:yes gene_type:complete